ncbi:MAG TPA: HDOD domain-containing protein [Burkholderiaceae bacterium]|nr:HDOD domain-containing protein [Burkholderiaceae bacterium]
MTVAARATSSRPAASVGRFELRRELGKGAQATVWLAFDPRLEREVAVKLLAASAGTLAVHQWLHEARAVSRLTHPHIVPLFEADEHQGRPYLVFEYVRGGTLSERLKAQGPMPAREAVTLMLGVLDALRTAHGMGIVHRDLKPSNILVDDDGRARVMDFGIAARTNDVGDGSIVGTPGYMSPEAARGSAPSPSMDIFAAGMMLGELLAGERLLRERDPYRAIRRVQEEDIVLPDSIGSRADDGLRGIVLRAVARDAARRYASAADMHQALTRWMEPAAEVRPDGAAAVATPAGSGTLEFLLRRMKHKSDFPALSDSIARIQRVANSEKESLNSLSNEILKDVALTNKLLRMVNSAYFSHAAGGGISTVSRAVALVGFAGIRNMALSLVLLEHMHDKEHANHLKDEFLRALMAGSVAAELSAVGRDGEEAFIGAMFQNLGRLLTEFYFPEEAARVRELTWSSGKSTAPAMSEEKASTQVLGLSFEELAIGVAKSWGLPEPLQKTMRVPTGDPPSKVAERGPERMRWLGAAANAVTDALLQSEPGRAASRIGDVAQRYGKVLGIGEKDLQTAAEQARNRLTQLAQGMNLSVAPGSRARRLLASGNVAIEAETVAAEDSLAAHQLQATIVTNVQGDVDVHVGADKTIVLAPPQEKVAELLAAGIQDVTNHMVAESFKLNEVLRMILETMFRALCFRRIVFCLRDPKTDSLTGRFGLGEAVEMMCKSFRVPLRRPLQEQVDLFSAVCLKGVDTVISDSGAAAIAARLPPWYREQVNAPAFLLLPLMVKGSPIALIYADKAQRGGIELGEKELSLLRTLRNQAVMAFRQAG